MISQNRPALGRLAATYASSATDRDDLLQEIAMALWHALPSFRGECSDRTFLFRIAHNRAIAYVARTHGYHASPAEEFDLADPEPDAETRLLHQEDGQRLADAVRTLPVLYRQAIVLLLEGFEYNEIAEIMGISESNVGVRLSRARQFLRKRMEVHK